jgi:ABC-type transport system involved in multi-copper enzyme maturation permease subunit
MSNILAILMKKAGSPSQQTLHWRWIGTTLVCLAPVAAFGVARSLRAPLRVLAALLCLQQLISGWLQRARSGPRLLGPIFRFDLSRLARRGRTPLVRSAYGFAILLLLQQLFQKHFPSYTLLDQTFGSGPKLSAQTWARFAADIVAGFTALQGSVVFLITPAYVASALADERERGSLDLLFTTPLLTREIVLGKLFGRLGHLAGIVLIGLPVLSLMPLWGGVASDQVLAGFAVTLLTLLSVGGISILCSSIASTVPGATVSSYVLVALFALLCFALPSCFPPTFLDEFAHRFSAALEAWSRGPGNRLPPWSAALLGLPPAPNATLFLLTMVGQCALLHGSVFLICTWLAVGSLRPVAPRPPKKQSPPKVRPTIDLEASWGPYQEPEILLGRAPRVISPNRVPVSDHVLLWREVYHSAIPLEMPHTMQWLLQRWYRLPLLLAQLAALFTLWRWLFPETWAELILGLNPAIRFLTVVLNMAWCLALGFRAAVSVCRERAQRTLESLFLFPEDRVQVLRAKWLGSILRWRLLGYGVLIVLLLGLVSGALHAYAVVLLAAACVIYAALVASVGLWVSLLSRNVLGANLVMALVLLVIFANPLIEIPGDVQVAGGTSEAARPQSLVEPGLSPARTCWFLGFSWDEFAAGMASPEPGFRQALVYAFGWLCLLSFVSWCFWLLCCVRFRREG